MVANLQCLSILKIGMAKRWPIIKISYKSLNFLRLLDSLNIISIYCLAPTYVGVRIDNRQNLDIKILYKKSTRRFFSRDSLIFLKNRCGLVLFLVYYRKSLLTIDDAIKNRHGGFLFCSFNVKSDSI